MSQRTRIVALGAILTVALCIELGRAAAEGVPTMEPLAYSGTLEESGVLVNGTRSIGVTVWRDPTSLAGSMIACTTPPRATTIVEGRFRVALDDTCVAAFANDADLWVQVEVGGMPLPRTHVGAVPYALEAMNGVPSGTILPFAGEAIPDGWLLCDGRPLDRDLHPSLFAAIGTAWGSGTSDSDPATDFNLPDLRGEFLRGVDGGRGIDPQAAARVAAALGGNSGDRVGSAQEDATARPSTAFTSRIRDSNGSSGDGSCFDSAPGCDARYTPIAVDGGGDLETRPRNVAVLFIIRE